MTFHFPDVSRYTPNVDVSKYPVVLARATMSDGTHGNIDETDPTFPVYRAAAKTAGTLCLAYHWLNHGNLKAQAAHCFSIVGPKMPVMIDAEDVAGNTGYNGPLTVSDITMFATEYRALGGIVSLVYLPEWYWSGHMNGPNLAPLTTAGLHLVSSYYTTYSDTGPGWNGYGGIYPVQWQYTDTPIDMNAFKGTLRQYYALVGVPLMNEDDMGVIAKGSDGQYYHCVGGFSHPIDAAKVVDIRYLASQGVYQLATGAGDGPEWTDGGQTRLGWNEAAFGPVYVPSGGLSDTDRALLQACTDAVIALNSRLATP